MFEAGRADNFIDEHNPSPLMSMIPPFEGCKDYFSVLRPDETHLYRDSLDFISGCEWDSLPTGRYWIIAKVKSLWWRDTEPPIWTGECWSDTVWFRIE